MMPSYARTESPVKETGATARRKLFRSRQAIATFLRANETPLRTGVTGGLDAECLMSGDRVSLPRSALGGRAFS
jgi:hypothetical protein